MKTIFEHTEVPRTRPAFIDVWETPDGKDVLLMVGTGHYFVYCAGQWFRTDTNNTDEINAELETKLT